MPPWSSLARRVGLGLAGLLLALAAASWWRDRDLPRHEGASARLWLERYARDRGRMERGRLDLESLLRGKTAFVRMGTSSIPFLVDRTFRYQPDSAFRQRLREMLHQRANQLPDWINDHVVLPRGDLEADSAAELLHLLRPPAEILLTELAPHLADTNLLPQRAATYLLGTVGRGASNAVPHLIRALEQDADPVRRHQALTALLQIGPDAAGAVPALARVAPSLPLVHQSAVARLAGRLGPAARDLVPLLETCLARTNPSSLPLEAALALRRIELTHARAEQILQEAGKAPAQTALERMGFAPFTPRTILSQLVLQMDAEADPWLRNLLARWLQEEIPAWTDPWNGTPALGDALQRVDGRVFTALLKTVEGRPDSRLGVALRLLRADPSDEAAAARILSVLDSARADQLGLGALAGLGAASSSNGPAMQRLRAWAGSPPSANHPMISQSLPPGAVRQFAREALARIRFREAVIAHRHSLGLPITESWFRLDPLAFP